jgi:hypothetical protein
LGLITFGNAFAINDFDTPRLAPIYDDVAIPQPKQSNDYISELSQFAAKFGNEYRENNQCGGVIEAAGGAIVYKLNENITNKEVCVWTVIVPRKWTIQVQLIADGFTKSCTNCQILYVLNMTTSDLLQPALEYARTGDRNSYNITGGSVIQVTLTDTTSEHHATGFALTFQGVGEDTNSSDWRVPSYKVLQPPQQSSGLIRYPETGNIYPTREILFVTIHPEMGKRIALTLDSLNITTRYDDYGCWNDHNAFVVTDRSWSLQPYSTRFSECKTTTQPTTIFSRVPLVINFHSRYEREVGAFQFSWKMVN